MKIASKILPSLFVTVVITGTLVLLAYQFSSAQVNPTGTPPSGNVPAPVNVGSSTQQKQGHLGADVFFAAGEMRSDRYCDAFGNNCFDEPSSLVNMITYTTNQNPQNYPERTACSCAAGDMLTGCSGFQRGDNDAGPLGTGRQGCYSDGSTIPSCHCIKTNALRSTDEVAYWHVSTWSQCTPTNVTSCSPTPGTQTRTAECRDMITGTVLPSTRCTGTPPSTSQSCTAWVFCPHEGPDNLGDAPDFSGPQ